MPEVSGTLTADISVVKRDLVEFLLGFGLCFSKALSCSLKVCRTARNVQTHKLGHITQNDSGPDQVQLQAKDSPTSLL